MCGVVEIFGRLSLNVFKNVHGARILQITVFVKSM